MNNKGYLTAELVVSAAMALVLATFLINMTINFKSKNDDEYMNTVFSVEKSVITKRIMDDIQTYDLNKIIVDNNNREITFAYGICPTNYPCFHTIRKMKMTSEGNNLKIEYGPTCTGQKDSDDNLDNIINQTECQNFDNQDKDYYTKTINNAYLSGNQPINAEINNTDNISEKILNIKISIRNYFTKYDYSINLLIPYNINGVTVETSPLNPVP